MKKYVSLIFLLFLFTSCTKEFKTINEFYKWLDNKDNELKQTKISGDKIIEFKNLPSAFLTYRDIKDDTTISQIQIDSTSTNYKKNRTFLLTIKCKNENECNDVLFEQLNSMEELDMVSKELNFSFEESIQLKTDEGHTYYPVLCNMENTYGLQKHRKFIVVFAPRNKEENDILTSKSLEITYTDFLFNTGIHHFIFNKKKLDQPIKIVFNNFILKS